MGASDLAAAGLDKRLPGSSRRNGCARLSPRSKMVCEGVAPRVSVNLMRGAQPLKE